MRDKQNVVMINILRIIYTSSSVVLMLAFTQCSNFSAIERSSPMQKLENPRAQSQNVLGYSADYSAVYRKIIQARKLEKRAPGEAIARYLSAAKIAYISRDKKLMPLYNHAVGQVADLVTEHKGISHSLQQPKGEKDEFTRKGFDDIIPVDCMRLKGWRTHVRQDGIGAPVVVMRAKASIVGKDAIFVTPRGQSYAATAVIEFPQNKKPVLRFYNPTKKEKIVFWGKSHMLANDLTASLAVSLKDSSSISRDIMLKWFGVFTPMQYVQKMGLYMTAPFDAQKIPIVLVHGLKSDPVAWRNVINELNADPYLRKRYQFLAFYYPTGLPLRVPSARLKREINKLNKLYQDQGMKKNADQMVIIGHSLGGLLTSVQVRKIDKDLLQKAFKTPIDRLQLNQRAMRDYQYLIDGPKPSFVKRVVFVATPHQGSRRADIYPVRLLSSLVEIPKQLLLLQVPETAAALTDFGRSLFGSEKRENSLSLLKSQSGTLTILKKSPVYKHIRYHSIMGDRGRGNSPNSTDGIVDYRSSHLDGAESEKIVPSGHNAHDHPQAIKEMNRILRLHLRSK